MKQKLEIDTGLLKVGDRVRLIPDTITWKGELALQGQAWSSSVETMASGSPSVLLVESFLCPWMPVFSSDC